MGRFGIGEILVVLAVVILLFGVKNLPKIGRAAGDALREFKKALGSSGDDTPSDGQGHAGE